MHLSPGMELKDRGANYLAEVARPGASTIELMGDG